MGRYVLPDGVAKTIVWIGAIGYIVSFLTFALKVILKHIEHNFENFVKYGFLLLGFVFLSISTFQKALVVQKNREHMEDSDFLFKKLTRMGWACMTFHFITLYLLPHHTHVYYLFALIGYGLLTLGKKFGTLSLTTFYIFSISLAFTHPVVDYAVMPSKILNMIYIGSYSYIFMAKYFGWDRRIENESEEKEKML